jgi:5-methyltetrahydrofolate--homocysteine methyltransferase
LTEGIKDNIRKSLLSYDSKGVQNAVREAMDVGLDPLDAVNVLTSTMREVGDMFATYEIYLPHLMMAAEAMKAGMVVLEPIITGMKKEIPIEGTIVIGTVKGDLHDIGKNMVVTMLRSEGFRVIDLGTDVSLSSFAQAVDMYKPDIVGASALMTTTRIVAKDLIEYFEALDIRDKCKIMVGGSAFTPEYAEEIGADGYAESCVETVKEAKKLVDKSI